MELDQPDHGRYRGSGHPGRHQVGELRADSSERSIDGCDPDDPRPRGLRQKVQSHDCEKHEFALLREGGVQQPHGLRRFDCIPGNLNFKLEMRFDYSARLMLRLYSNQPERKTIVYLNKVNICLFETVQKCIKWQMSQRLFFAHGLNNILIF